MNENIKTNESKTQKEKKGIASYIELRDKLCKQFQLNSQLICPIYEEKSNTRNHFFFNEDPDLCTCFRHVRKIMKEQYPKGKSIDFAIGKKTITYGNISFTIQFYLFTKLIGNDLTPRSSLLLHIPIEQLPTDSIICIKQFMNISRLKIIDNSISLPDWLFDITKFIHHYFNSANVKSDKEGIPDQFLDCLEHSILSVSPISGSIPYTSVSAFELMHIQSIYGMLMSDEKWPFLVSAEIYNDLSITSQKVSFEKYYMLNGNVLHLVLKHTSKYKKYLNARSSWFEEHDYPTEYSQSVKSNPCIATLSGFSLFLFMELAYRKYKIFEAIAKADQELSTKSWFRKVNKLRNLQHELFAEADSPVFCSVQFIDLQQKMERCFHFDLLLRNLNEKYNRTIVTLQSIQNQRMSWIMLILAFISGFLAILTLFK